MARITEKGKVWELRNSIWMLWAILTLGFFSYVSFFYASYKVKQRKWFIAGIIYSALFIMLIVVMESVPVDHWFYNVTFMIYFIGWIASIVHVFKIRPEYLLRLEAKISSGYKEKEMQSLKQKITQEYAAAHSIKREEHSIADNHVVEEQPEMIQPVEKEKEKEPSSEVQMIDVNKASEADIAKVPGIGGLFAKKVISVREQENGFTSFDHFVEALAIKPHLIEKIKPYLIFPDHSHPEQTKKTEGRVVDF
ncbi:helix-hairpin-helix domain-containing protein [Bacillus sp. B190/17]|uniref:Helix-hairpin-helix domain-containing protein n=1 Tax=Bacillus lumedeiriae TaxID=3058829 RepID=A0ABW8I936_9BACI